MSLLHIRDSVLPVVTCSPLFPDNCIFSNVGTENQYLFTIPADNPAWTITCAAGNGGSYDASSPGGLGALVTLSFAQYTVASTFVVVPGQAGQNAGAISLPSRGAYGIARGGIAGSTNAGSGGGITYLGDDSYEYNIMELGAAGGSAGFSAGGNGGVVTAFGTVAAGQSAFGGPTLCAGGPGTNMTGYGGSPRLGGSQRES